VCYRHYRQAIAKQSLQNLEHWQLPASQLFGQTYDGAGSMAGKRKGVAAKISEQYPKALRIQCASHVLSLCTVSCCSIPDVRNTMDMAECVQRFFDNSPKCQLALERWITDVLPDNEKEENLSQYAKPGGLRDMKLLKYFLICLFLWFVA